MQTQGKEAKVACRREPRVAGLPGEGAEASAVYLQAAGDPLQQDKGEHHRQRVRRSGGGLCEQRGEQVQYEQDLEARQRVGRERNEPFGRPKLVGGDRGGQRAGVGDLGRPREEEHAAEHDPVDQRGVRASKKAAYRRKPLLAFVHQNGYSTAR